MTETSGETGTTPETGTSADVATSVEAETSVGSETSVGTTSYEPTVGVSRGRSQAAHDVASVTTSLRKAGVEGVIIACADNNGIPRSRTVPVASLPEVAVKGVGVTALLSVFDSHDSITFEHEPLSTPSGDVRLIPVLDRLTPLAGQPSFAWAPGRYVGIDGGTWPYDQRTALMRQVDLAANAGLSMRAGFELEFFVAAAEEVETGRFYEPRPAHAGPAYSPHALLAVDEFAARVMRDLAANGVRIGQLHAEFGIAQVEVSLAAADPVTAADQQLLARQTIHAAARAHGLRVCFAPLVTMAGMGNGWHLHTSVWRDGRNLLAGQRGPTAEGAAYVAGLLRELPGIVGVTAPSAPSMARLRPRHLASAYGFWGIENREAALRYVLGSPLLGAEHANVELKPADASANPYLALAVVLAAGRAGIADQLRLPPPIQHDPGDWAEADRTAAGVRRLPAASDEREEALRASPAVREALGDQLFGAFLAVRRSDADWAADRSLDEIIGAHRWLY